MIFSEIQHIYKMNYSSVKNFNKYKTLAISVPKKFIYKVQLNRPEKLNVLNDIMWKCVFLLSIN